MVKVRTNRHNLGRFCGKDDYSRDLSVSAIRQPPATMFGSSWRTTEVSHIISARTAKEYFQNTKLATNNDITAILNAPNLPLNIKKKVTGALKNLENAVEECAYIYEEIRLRTRKDIAPLLQTKLETYLSLITDITNKLYTSIAKAKSKM